jgi:hypothetical protein
MYMWLSDIISQTRMLEDFKGGRLGNWRNNDFSIISFTCMDM